MPPCASTAELIFEKIVLKLPVKWGEAAAEANATSAAIKAYSIISCPRRSAQIFESQASHKRRLVCSFVRVIIISRSAMQAG